MDKPTTITFVEPTTPDPITSGGTVLHLAAYLAGRMAKLGTPPPVLGPRLPGCMPWCTEHTGGAPTDDPDAYCQASFPSPVLGALKMYKNAGHTTGPLFGLWCLRDVDPTLDEMEALALASLRMIYAARRAVAG